MPRCIRWLPAALSTLAALTAAAPAAQAEPWISAPAPRPVLMDQGTTKDLRPLTVRRADADGALGAEVSVAPACAPGIGDVRTLAYDRGTGDVLAIRACFGYRADSRPTLFRSTDGGASWSAGMPLDLPAPMWSPSALRATARDGRLYVAEELQPPTSAGLPTRLAAFDVATGARRWLQDDLGGGTWLSGAIGDPRVDPASGDVLLPWTSMDAERRLLRRTPGGTVVAVTPPADGSWRLSEAGDGTVVAVSRDGDCGVLTVDRPMLYRVRPYAGGAFGAPVDAGAVRWMHWCGGDVYGPGPAGTPTVQLVRVTAPAAGGVVDCDGFGLIADLDTCSEKDGPGLPPSSRTVTTVSLRDGIVRADAVPHQLLGGVADDADAQELVAQALPLGGAGGGLFVLAKARITNALGGVSRQERAATLTFAGGGIHVPRIRGLKLSADGRTVTADAGDADGDLRPGDTAWQADDGCSGSALLSCPQRLWGLLTGPSLSTSVLAGPGIVRAVAFDALGQGGPVAELAVTPPAVDSAAPQELGAPEADGPGGSSAGDGAAPAFAADELGEDGAGDDAAQATDRASAGPAPLSRRKADAAARDRARALATAVELCDAEHGVRRGYRSCTRRAALSGLDAGFPWGAGPGQAKVTRATATTWTLVSRSLSGATFRLTRGSKRLTGTCTPAGRGGCPRSGRWMSR